MSHQKRIISQASCVFYADQALALPLVLVVLVILFTLGSALMTLNNTGIKQLRHSFDSYEATALADSGAELAIAHITTHYAVWDPSDTTVLNGITVNTSISNKAITNVSIAKTSPDSETTLITVTSTAKSGTITRTAVVKLEQKSKQLVIDDVPYACMLMNPSATSLTTNKAGMSGNIYITGTVSFKNKLSLENGNIYLVNGDASKVGNADNLIGEGKIYTTGDPFTVGHGSNTINVEKTVLSGNMNIDWPPGGVRLDSNDYPTSSQFAQLLGRISPVILPANMGGTTKCFVTFDTSAAAKTITITQPISNGYIVADGAVTVVVKSRFQGTIVCPNGVLAIDKGGSVEGSVLAGSWNITDKYNPDDDDPPAIKFNDDFQYAIKLHDTSPGEPKIISWEGKVDGG